MVLVGQGKKGKIPGVPDPEAKYPNVEEEDRGQIQWLQGVAE